MAGSIGRHSAGDQASSPRGPTQLDSATKIVVPWQGFWRFGLCEAAAEGGGSFRYVIQRRRGYGEESEPDPERAAEEAGRRARGKIRRYCAANRLNRLGTLTYAGEGCHDARRFREDVGAFFRRLRKGMGGEAFPYVWVPEWHAGGHGLHAHVAVGRYMPRGLIECSWGQGFVNIKLIADLPVGSGALEEARVAARYLAKYVSKAFDDRREIGLHRYDVARGFEPSTRLIVGRLVEEVLDQASVRMGGPPDVVWESRGQEGWAGPPVVWASWPG